MSDLALVIDCDRDREALARNVPLLAQKASVPRARLTAITKRWRGGAAQEIAVLPA